MDCCTPSRRAISASRTPAARHCPGPLPVLLRHRAGPAPRPDQPGGPLPLRPLVQRGHVVRRQPQRRRDLRAGEPDLPQRGHRDVPHGGIAVGEPNSAVFPAKIHVTPSERSTRRSAASGMPSRMADAAADGMPQSYR